MKRLISMALVIVLMITSLVSVAACSNKEESSSTPSTSTTGQTVVQVATDATWPPFESINDQKQIEGFDIDLFNAIAAKENLKLEFINVGFDPLLAGMAQGTYDAAISSITITADRQKQMLFSNPYFAAGQIVVVQKSNTTIKGKDTLTGNVGAQIGTTGAIEIGKLSAVTSKTYDDISLAFQDLMNGQINAVVCDNPVAVQYVNANSSKLKIVGTTFTDESYGIAVANGKTDLLAKINAGLALVKAAGTIDELAAKWLK
jgi:polar amino acid transport system substrate-binding protein